MSIITTTMILGVLLVLIIVADAWWFNRKKPLDDFDLPFLDPLVPVRVEWAQVANVVAELPENWQVTLTLKRNTDVHIALIDENLEERAWGYNGSAVEAMEWILEQLNEVNQSL